MSLNIIDKLLLNDEFKSSTQYIHCELQKNNNNRGTLGKILGLQMLAYHIIKNYSHNDN